MYNQQQYMPQQQDYDDPLMEPETLSDGFTLVPEGLQLLKIDAVKVDFNWESNGGIKGQNWEIKWSFPDTIGAQAKIFCNTASDFGRTQLHNFLLNARVPYTIPNPQKLSKSTGQPLKSFSQALIRREVDGKLTLIEENIVDRLLYGIVSWRVKCPDCGWLHTNGNTMTKNACKHKDLELCHFGSNKIVANPKQDKVFLDVDLMSLSPFTDEMAQNYRPQTNAQPQPSIQQQQNPQQSNQGPTTAPLPQQQVQPQFPPNPLRQQPQPQPQLQQPNPLTQQLQQSINEMQQQSTQVHPQQQTGQQPGMPPQENIGQGSQGNYHIPNSGAVIDKNNPQQQQTYRPMPQDVGAMHGHSGTLPHPNQFHTQQQLPQQQVSPPYNQQTVQAPPVQQQQPGNQQYHQQPQVGPNPPIQNSQLTEDDLPF